MPIKTRVFICYRQVDGKDAAGWLYRELHGQTHPLVGHGSDDTQQLDVYFDQAAPALSDWQALHRPSLEAAHALLVVCTPGMFSRLGLDDWVHMEIDWWLQNRKTAPILIDTTDEGARWIPPAIVARWPNAQRLRLDLKELEHLPEAQRAAAVQMLVQRIVGGISSSDEAVRFEELEQQRAMLQRQKTLLGYIAAGIAATAVASVAAAWFSHRSQLEAERRLAGTLLQQANAAMELDNSDFAKILSAEALVHDGSVRTRNAAAVIHHWYADEPLKAIERFDSLLSEDYQRLVEEGVKLRRSQRHARGQSVISALNTYLTLTATARRSGYDWVYRLGGFGPRMERSIRSAALADGSAGPQLEQLVDASSEVARYVYHRPATLEDADHCAREREAAASRAARLEQEITSRASRRATAAFDVKQAGVQLQSRLQQGQVMVHYWRYRDRYAAWVIAPDAPVQRVELGSALEVEKAAKDFIQDLTRTASSRPKVARPDTPTDSPNRFARGVSSPSGPASASRPAAATQTSGPTGARLRALVWDPVSERMPKGSTLVYVVPDAAIASVPFAALPDGGDGGHLLDRLHFAHLTTAQDLMDDPAPVAGEGILLVASQVESRTTPSKGGAASSPSRAIKLAPSEAGSTPARERARAPPARDAEAKCAREVLDHRMFPTLPGSELEVREISAMLQLSGAAWVPRMLLGDEAHERSVREAMSGRRILHFATHAWLDSQLFGRPTNEGLPLIDAKARASIDANLVNADPLLRTGLLLARRDATAGLSDGYLTGYEIATLNLSGVELVVLSACDTAGSSRGGNGLIGLATAFREAGARSVVASLYPVDDEATAELMTRFYRKLSQGVPPPLALTDAMRTLKRDGFGAYLWAPFVAYSMTVAQ